MSRYKISGHRLEISGRRLEISGRQQQSSPGGSDGICWAEMSLQLRIGAQILHENMLVTCSLMYVQLIFIAYHIKTCVWL